MFALTPYRANQTRTFERQKELPRLPIQTLDASLDKYLRTLRPFLLDQADAEGHGQDWVDKELDQRRQWAADFVKQGGLGKVLQERLKGASSFLWVNPLRRRAAGELTRATAPSQTSTASRRATGSTTTSGSRSRTTRGACRFRSTATGGSCVTTTSASRPRCAAAARRKVRPLSTFPPFFLSCPLGS